MTATNSRCFIGLGSNLGEPLTQIQNALENLQNEAQIQLVKVSSFYQSRALTLPDSAPQNDYINAVALLETSLSPEQLLVKLNHVENLQGRERESKWGPRTLDLDILLYDDLCLQTDRLTIPHAQIKYRNFVIFPLLEIDNALVIPELGKLSSLAEQLTWEGLQKQ